MTSETAFAQHHISTWRVLAPTLDLYIRKINLQLYKREFPILKSEVESGRRGFINEIAFKIYGATYDRPSTEDRWTGPSFDRIVRSAKNKISQLERTSSDDIASPNRVEILDCIEQEKRLRSFFSGFAAGKKIEINPYFPGAGIIRSCEGDIYCDSTLFEVKAGQRTFRAVDLKQLLVYAALNNSAASRRLEQVGLFNPSMGISFNANLDSICVEISGYSAAELLPEIVRIISSGDISR